MYSYLLDYNKESGKIVLSAGNAGGFNLIELLRQYMPLEEINIRRIQVEKDDRAREN